MSKKFFPTSEALKKLEDQLTCPICLGHLTNPKILPCLHSFCQHCLQAVSLDLVQSDKYQLPCPTCRSSCELPETGVASLPTSFLINNLTEVYSLLKKISGSGDVSCDNCEKKTSASGYCKKCGLFYCQGCLDHHQKLKLTSDHEIVTMNEVVNSAYQLPAVKSGVSMKCSNHDKPLDIYCETCEELVCQHCTVRIHKHHTYDVLTDAYQKHIQALETGTVQPLKEEVTRISEALAELMKRRDQVFQQGEEVKGEIRMSIQDVIKQLHEMEKQLNEKVEKAVEVKVGILNEQVQSVELALGKLIEFMDYTQQSMKVGTPQEILSQKVQIKGRLKNILSEVRKEKLEPFEQPDIKLIQNSKLLPDNLINLWDVCYSLFPNKVNIIKEQLPLVGRESTCTLSLSSCDGSPVPVPSSLISCSLSTPDSKLSIECDVKKSRQTGEYTITFTPITRGLHRLHVRIGKSYILGTSVSVAISIPPEKRGTPVSVITGFNKPCGVLVTEEGLMIVSEFDGHCITILNNKRKKIRSFGSRGSGRGRFNHPTGTAITGNGSILVADRDNHCIQQFTMEGKCISCVGSKGTGPLQFIEPRNIAISKTTGQVFVADSGNHRIQVLNPNLSFSHTIGVHGSRGCEFNEPWGVTIDDTGGLFITDTYNHRVQHLSPEGTFISMFETSTFRYPVGIVYHDEVLYISEQGSSGCLSMYTTGGKFISSFGSTLQLIFPQFMTVDNEGYLYLCEFNNSRLFKL